jgi:hypothetical protein
MVFLPIIALLVSQVDATHNWACTAAVMKCGSSHYLCYSQSQARAQCQTAGMDLCTRDQLRSEIGEYCAWQWTADSDTTQYIIGNGGDGCGAAGAWASASQGVGDAACCHTDNADSIFLAEQLSMKPLDMISQNVSFVDSLAEEVQPVASYTFTSMVVLAVASATVSAVATAAVMTARQRSHHVALLSADSA